MYPEAPHGRIFGSKIEAYGAGDAGIWPTTSNVDIALQQPLALWGPVARAGAQRLAANPRG